ncbi:MAG TPA: DNA cytosine methyltransferase [Ktedonobacteraceae bacterium]|nr:DNA cytosine methyltransferase [Ktedonobacteraceae bacterium]
MAEKELSVVSLFSGAGGFDWGFHRAGFRTVLACELLKDASATLAHNLKLEILKAPITPIVNGTPSVIHGDIQDVDFSAAAFSPDVLIGGPPCQDFSVVQVPQRPGLNGGRGQLYVEFVRAVMFFQPKIFVFENVPGLMSVNDQLVYTTIQNDLENLEEKRLGALETGTGGPVPQQSVHSYKLLFSGVVDGTRVGVPQARRRLIIIGLRQDLADNLDELFEMPQLQNDLKKELAGGDRLLWKYPLTCIEIFEGQPLNELQAKYVEIMEAYQDILTDPTLPKAAEWRERVWDKLELKIVKDYYTANQLDYTKHDPVEFDKAMKEHRNLLENLGWLGKPVYEQQFEDGSGTPPKETQAVTERMRRIPPDENSVFVNDTEWKVESKDISFIYRRSAPLKPAWTVMAHGGGGTYGYHYERRRGRLSLRELARIQTFTDDFLFKGTGSSGMRAQIGEAVPPILAEHIAHAVREVLRRTSAQDG